MRISSSFLGGKSKPPTIKSILGNRPTESIRERIARKQAEFQRRKEAEEAAARKREEERLEREEEERRRKEEEERKQQEDMRSRSLKASRSSSSNSSQSSKPQIFVQTRPKDKPPTKPTTMGLFSKIFKKKPGGTLVGNLIRGGARALDNKFTGGMLGIGQGKNMIPPKKPTYTRTVTPAGANQKSSVMGTFMKGAAQEYAKTEQGKEAVKAFSMEWIKQNAVKIGSSVVALGLIIFGIYKLASNKRGTKRRR